LKASASASCPTAWPLRSTQMARYSCVAVCCCVLLLALARLVERYGRWDRRKRQGVCVCCTVLQCPEGDGTGTQCNIHQHLGALCWSGATLTHQRGKIFMCVALRCSILNMAVACLDQRYVNLDCYRWQGIVMLAAQSAYSTHFVSISIEPPSCLVVVCWAVKIGHPVCLCHCIPHTARLKCIIVVLGTWTSI